MGEPFVVACTSCGRKNRVDPAREGARCGACKTSLEISPGIVELDDASFRRFVVESPLPVLVDFHATWCGPCQVMAPHLEEVARQRRARLRVVKVDIDGAPATAERFGVTAVPTLVLVRGPVVVSRVEGAQPLPQLLDWVDRSLGPA